MFKLDAIFGTNKSNPIKSTAANTEGISSQKSPDIILFSDGESIDITSLNLTSADKKNLEIAIALADINSMSGLED